MTADIIVLFLSDAFSQRVHIHHISTDACFQRGTILRDGDLMGHMRVQGQTALMGNKVEGLVALNMPCGAWHKDVSSR